MWAIRNDGCGVRRYTVVWDKLSAPITWADEWHTIMRRNLAVDVMSCLSWNHAEAAMACRNGDDRLIQIIMTWGCSWFNDWTFEEDVVVRCRKEDMKRFGLSKEDAQVRNNPTQYYTWTREMKDWIRSECICKDEWRLSISMGISISQHKLGRHPCLSSTCWRKDAIDESRLLRRLSSQRCGRLIDVSLQVRR